MAGPPRNNQFENIRVLILEDNPADAELQKYELRENEVVFQAKVVESKKGYIKALRDFRPDIILSDYDLPSFSGWEALQIKKKLCPETPFILVTGAIGEERAIEVLTGGATDYVLKKNLSRLLPAMHRALHEAYEHQKRKEAEAERDNLFKKLERLVQERTESLQSEIAERKNVEKSLIHSQKTLESALKAVPVGVMVAEPSGKILYINPAAYSILGEHTFNDIHDLASLCNSAVPDKSSIPGNEFPICHAIEGKKITDQEIRITRSTGSQAIILTRAEPLRTLNQSQFWGAIMTLEDITAIRRQTEFENVISRLLARFASCTAAEFDEEITIGLKEIGQFFGLENVFVILVSREFGTWSSVYNWIEEGAPSVLSKYQNVPLEKYPWSTSAILRVDAIQINSLDDLPAEAKEERRDWELEGLKSLLLVPLRGRGRLVTGSIGLRSYCRQIFWTQQDIRSLHIFSEAVANVLERKKTEEKLMEETAQLENSNKELESFSYSVSHDLRAPLRVIDGFSRMLLDEMKDLDEEKIKRIRTIQQNAVKMDLLIQDLLQFSRTGRAPISLNKLDVDRLVKEAWREQLNANPNRKMKLKAGDIPNAFGDQTLIRQVLSNLLSNAVKFSRQKKNALIEVGGESDGKETVFYVKDNGSGFDMQFCDKLFGVFQRLHSENEYEGTGVGLAIVQRIVNRHGGRVWARGKVGKGATFYFSLPAGKK